MYQRYEARHQHSLFDSAELLAPSLKKRLRTSGAEVFYDEGFCRPGSEVQLTTKIEVVPNTTDDVELLAHSLEGHAEREVEVEQVAVDGGYAGPTGKQWACTEHEVQLRSTRMCGGRGAPECLDYEGYQWKTDVEGEQR